MDKRKVITAYHRGFITLKECSQILGIDSSQIISMLNDPQFMEPSELRNEKKPVNG